jgi:hypothetical protein
VYSLWFIIGLGWIPLGASLVWEGFVLQGSAVLDALGYQEPPYADAQVRLGFILAFVGLTILILLPVVAATRVAMVREAKRQAEIDQLLVAYRSGGVQPSLPLEEGDGGMIGSAVILAVTLLTLLVTLAFWFYRLGGILMAMGGAVAVVILSAGLLLWLLPGRPAPS